MPKPSQVTNTKPKKSSVLDRIKPIEVDPFVKISLYGRSGTGKTTLAGTFPKPLLLIDIPVGHENGARSIQNVAGVDRIDIHHTDELLELLVNIPAKYKTIVLDHITNLQDMTLAEVLNVAELPAQKSWGMATQQQYGCCTLQVKEHIRRVMRFDGNVVLLNQERSFDVDGGDGSILEPSVSVDLSPSLKSWFNAAVDYNCQCFIRAETNRVEKKLGKDILVELKKTGKKEYCLRTGPHEVYTTKFRAVMGAKVPEVIVNPTYGKLWEIINASADT